MYKLRHQNYLPIPVFDVSIDRFAVFEMEIEVQMANVHVVKTVFRQFDAK